MASLLADQRDAWDSDRTALTISSPGNENGGGVTVARGVRQQPGTPLSPELNVYGALASHDQGNTVQKASGSACSCSKRTLLLGGTLQRARRLLRRRPPFGVALVDGAGAYRTTARPRTRTGGPTTTQCLPTCQTRSLPEL
ncbi:hypothetical protein EON66_04270 [archaeon]|nr:MAG: hypothetical protein EON66_04270 [archaeon]